MSELQIVLGQRIYEQRLRAQLTLRELAQLADCHFSALSRIERGERGVSDNLKIRIANALGVNPSTLFGLDDIAA